MIADWTILVLLLAIAWPLLLATALVIPVLRRPAWRLLPWAALPALAATALPDLLQLPLQLPLSGFLVGSELVLDTTGRAFLLLNAVLWLAAGVLAPPWRSIMPPTHQGVLLLVTMAGSMGMTLAGDALLFLAFSTLAGYGLLGLLLAQGDRLSRRAGAVLVVLLVISDLVLFELLLHVAHETAGTDFAAFRQAMVESHSRGLLLGLLIVGLGIKTGLAGLHFWIPPAFAAAAPATRPVLVSFVLTAGILAWIRLLPLGDADWTDGGVLLQWLGAITLGYAMLVGPRGRVSHSITGYAAMAMNGVWLIVLGTALVYPQTWIGLMAAAPAVWLQGGFALTVWMLVDARGVAVTPRGERWVPRLLWPAVVLLAISPLALTEALHTGPGLLSGLLAAALAVFIGYVLPAGRFGQPGERSYSAAAVSARSLGLTSLALLVVALFCALYAFGRLGAMDYLRMAWLLPAAVLLAWVARTPLERSLLWVMPTDSLRAEMGAGLMKTWQAARTLLSKRLPQWRDRVLAGIRILSSNPLWPGLLEVLEAGMTRWRNAFALILVVSLAVAGWNWGW